MWKCVTAFALAALVCAQTPMPNQGQSRQTRQGRRGTPQTGISPLETPVATFHGTVRSITKKEIVVDMAEEQSIAFHISHKTKFVKEEKAVRPTTIAAGASVTVDGKRDLLGNVDAVTVTVDSSKKPPEAAKPAEPGSSAAPPR
jgi:hypothetical protein